MKRYIARIAMSVLCAALLGSGCQTMNAKPAELAGEVVPGPAERITIDNVVLVVDASGSMYPGESFPFAKELARSFANAMPDGGYESGVRSYGGEWTNEWLLFPLQAFDRQRMNNGVAQLKFLTGSTRLPELLQMLTAEIQSKSGRTALVIISDGKADTARTLDAAAALIDAAPGDVCIHTVHVGRDDCGVTLLHNLAALSGCGCFHKGADLASASGMDAFVRHVFFAAAPERDSDGDGVPDSIDQCPDTPRGARVNEVGCWVLEGLNFDTDKADIKPQYGPILDEAAGVLRAHGGIRVRVDGHTDSTGSEAYNQRLSERRANSARDALVQRGVDSGRLTTQGFGESRPIADNSTKEGRAANRRVELTVTGR